MKLETLTTTVAKPVKATANKVKEATETTPDAEAKATVEGESRDGASKERKEAKETDEEQAESTSKPSNPNKPNKPKPSATDRLDQAHEDYLKYHPAGKVQALYDSAMIWLNGRHEGKLIAYC
jgi:hypothetical protein